jgi:A/G-specific adenine glycosylase
MLRELKHFYKKEGRSHLPWRKTRDPYKILVSELMLQQTQVARVIPKYKRFITVFPSFKVLAAAPLSKVLLEWQGLGYNRRAKFLHETAKIVTREFKGKFPKDPALIETLPGIGHYTARAVAAFAFNHSDVFIETNIRTVFTHHYFSENAEGSASHKVDDKEILPLIERDLKKSKMAPRDFYAALMDYGSYLKVNGVRINTKSKHYTKQSKFEGSTRQKRAALLRAALKAGVSEIELLKLLDA